MVPEIHQMCISLPLKIAPQKRTIYSYFSYFCQKLKFLTIFFSKNKNKKM